MTNATNAWNLSPDDFPHDGDPDDQLRSALRYAVLAPSSHNTQPWLFEIRDHAVELYADRSRALPVADPEGRELIISCGAALFNMRTALRRFGLAIDVDYFPSPADENLLARVRLRSGSADPGPMDVRLFDAIVKRHTNRRRFQRRALSPSVVRGLSTAADIEGAWLTTIAGNRKTDVSRLVAEADREQFHDRRFRQELAHWLTPNRSKRAEGVPGYALGINTVASYAVPLVIRAFDLGRLLGQRERRLAESAPVLAVLGTKDDTRTDWLRAGQAMERVLLWAQSHGVATSFLSAPIEIETFRSRLAHIVDEHDGPPQLLLRLGYAAQTQPTPRRDVDQVIRYTAAG